VPALATAAFVRERQRTAVPAMSKSWLLRAGRRSRFVAACRDQVGATGGGAAERRFGAVRLSWSRAVQENGRCGCACVFEAEFLCWVSLMAAMIVPAKSSQHREHTGPSDCSSSDYADVHQISFSSGCLPVHTHYPAARVGKPY
jgi:hypothetical protein